ncbi:MAG TPA: hypothetical protein VFC93_16580 [Chloroflexota bacterium]|nr:hypothetical protein [Chloroflexota bacterium]
MLGAPVGAVAWRALAQPDARATGFNRVVLPVVGRSIPVEPSSGATSNRSRVVLPFVNGPVAGQRPSSGQRPAQAPPPTPTPVLPLPERPPILKTTKWGVGVYREGNTMFDDLYTAQPGVVLLMDPSDGWARRIRAVLPRAFIVGRRYANEASQPLDDPEGRGAAFADAVAQRAVPLRGVVDAWVSYNEVTSHGGYADYARYNRFQVAFARRLQEVHGAAAVAGNDGSGAVEPEDYPRYFADAIRASRYFAVHAYSPPGTRGMRVDAEWHALRYRKIHDALEGAGIRGVKMVITESGLGNGWRGLIGGDAMAADFAWFTSELAKDPYVIGHASFGLFGDDEKWRAFDLHGTEVLARMGAYAG